MPTMAGSSTPSGGGKMMSSRLLTMKFMQRAAASSGSGESPQSRKNNSYADSSSHSDVPTGKRRRLSPPLSSPFSSHPTTPATPTTSDLSASVSAAVAAEEAARAEALARHSGVMIETRWVLEYPGLLNGVDHGTVDRSIPEYHADSSGTLETPLIGRRTYGDFKRRRKFDEKRDEEGELEETGSDEDEQHQKVKKLEEGYASKAQKKLRGGANPDSVNLGGLNGKISGFQKKDNAYEGKPLNSIKSNKWQERGKGDKKRRRTSEY